MTVVYFTNLSFPDGAMASGNRVMHLAKCLVSKGVRVVVFSPFADSGKAGHFELNGIEFRSFCRGGNSGLVGRFRSLLVYPLRAFAELRRLKDDQIVIHSYTGNVIHQVWACWFSRLLKLPITREGCELPYTVISHSPKFLQWIETRYVMRFYHGVIAMTKALEEYYRNACPDDCKIIRIPMTVDCSRFEWVGEGPFDFEYIAYTGAMNRNGGGVDFLVKAFGILSEKFSSLHLVLVGKGSDAIRSQLLQLLPEAARDRLHCLFTGKIPTADMPRYIANAKILAMLPLPTIQQEGCFPTKLGEYLSSGVPAVVSRVGIPFKILQDRQQVYFVDPGNPVQTAEILGEMLSDYDSAKSVAQRGREFARKNFHYEQFADGVNAWLREVVG